MERLWMFSSWTSVKPLSPVAFSWKSWQHMACTGALFYWVKHCLDDCPREWWWMCYSSWWPVTARVCQGSFNTGNYWWGKRKQLQAVPREVQVGHPKNFFTDGLSRIRAAYTVKEQSHHSWKSLRNACTWQCYDLVDMMVFGQKSWRFFPTLLILLKARYLFATVTAGQKIFKIFKNFTVYY